MLKAFVNSTKIPLILPLLVGNQFVTGYEVNFFNNYFSQQCKIIGSNSSIPANVSFETEGRFFTSEICSVGIVKIEKSLDPNEAHGHDEISIHMIKTYASSISKPPAILFKNCFKNECFPKERKKANIVPTHKKI